MQGAFLTPDTQYQNGKNLLCQRGALFFIEYFMKRLWLHWVFILILKNQKELIKAPCMFLTIY